MAPDGRAIAMIGFVFALAWVERAALASVNGSAFLVSGLAIALAAAIIRRRSIERRDRDEVVLEEQPEDRTQELGLQALR